MRKLLVLLVVVGAVWFGVRHFISPGGPDLTIEGDEILLATGDLDVRFSKGKALDETFMLFGGSALEHRNAVANVTVAGLAASKAKPIYRRYPDFHRCASPGASLAKEQVTQLDMVPVDGETLAVLTASLDDFEESIRNDGDRVCVQLRGSRLKLTSAEIREIGEDVTDTFTRSAFYLVDSASRVECQEALGGA